MPPAAFKSLRDTLKAESHGSEPSRIGNGDFYWVLATASPIHENGKITGYTSIRTKLPTDQRALAEQVYAAIREKREDGYRIDAGIIRRRSVFDRFAIFTTTFKARLFTMMAIQSMFLLAIWGGSMMRDVTNRMELARKAGVSRLASRAR